MHQLENKSRGETAGIDAMQHEGEGGKVRGVGGNMGDMGF
jgi:hypothetical protein